MAIRLIRGWDAQDGEIIMADPGDDDLKPNNRVYITSSGNERFFAYRAPTNGWAEGKA